MNDVRLHGISEIIRPDDASELKGGNFAGHTALSKSLRRQIGCDGRIDAQAKPGYLLDLATNHCRDCVSGNAKESEQVLVTCNVIWQYVPRPIWQYVPPPLRSSDEQTIPVPVEGAETGVATGEGREGILRPGGGGEDVSQDDDDNLDVTWVGLSGAADDIDAAASETPKTDELYVRGVVSGGGQSDAPSPRSSNSDSNYGSSNSGSSNSTSSSNTNGSSSSGSDVSDMIVEVLLPLVTAPLNCPRENRVGCRAGTTR